MIIYAPRIIGKKREKMTAMQVLLPTEWEHAYKTLCKQKGISITASILEHVKEAVRNS